MHLSDKERKINLGIVAMYTNYCYHYFWAADKEILQNMLRDADKLEALLRAKQREQKQQGL